MTMLAIFNGLEGQVFLDKFNPPQEGSTYEYKVLFLDSRFLAQMIRKQLVLSQREIEEGINNISDSNDRFSI